MHLDSAELAYLIARERQEEFLAEVATPSPHVWRNVADRLKTALSR